MKVEMISVASSTARAGPISRIFSVIDFFLKRATMDNLEFQRRKRGARFCFTVFARTRREIPRSRNCQVLSPFLIEETRRTVSPSTMTLEPVTSTLSPTSMSISCRSKYHSAQGAHKWHNYLPFSKSCLQPEARSALGEGDRILGHHLSFEGLHGCRVPVPLVIIR